MIVTIANMDLFILLPTATIGPTTSTLVRNTIFFGLAVTLVALTVTVVLLGPKQFFPNTQQMKGFYHDEHS